MARRMGSRALAVAAVVIAAGMFGAPGRAAAAPTGASVGEIVAALHAIEGRRLWPGFDLARVPVAIYDGQNTYLLRHPAPPPEFSPVADGSGLVVAPGQHTAVRANTSTPIGGVLTATCMAVGDRTAAGWASIIAHEAFHVFQHQTHDEWVTNEMVLFTYPSEDVTNLAQARLEAAALERAVASADAADAACWTRTALRIRRARFAAISPDAASYERGVELVEGTASLVQYRSGDSSQASISGTGLAADGTRLRAYATGRTLGLLLDRFAAGWEDLVQAARPQPALDEILNAALPPAEGGPCAAASNEVEAHRQAAAKAVDALVARRTQAQHDFQAAPGWRVIVRAPEGASLGPQAFDPMNVIRFGGTEVLHTRWLKAGRNGGWLEVLNRRSLTRAAGAHPVFSGFREVEVTGLPTEPVVTPREEGLTLQADGVHAEFPRATVTRAEKTITIQVR